MASASCCAKISVLGKQCIAVHIYYLASNAYLYDLVLGKQGLHIQVLQIREHDRMAVQYFASSVQNRSCAISAPARWEHIPNPEITLRVSCAFSRFPFYTLTKNADILALIVFWLHHLYHRAAYMEFHSDPDRNGSLSGSDHCRNRSDRGRITDGQ